ncbi:MAG TPA: hypothetical protein VFH27_12985, partial [Longimicrobiaceae bacterium]|nr:hypothetical protein [Longimicrobiaceae bacterium]
RPGRGGVGAANTRQRLQQLYGERASFALSPAEGGGALATVRLPWHEVPLDTAASSSDVEGILTITERE